MPSFFWDRRDRAAWRWQLPMPSICRARTGSRTIPAEYAHPAGNTKNWAAPRPAFFATRSLPKTKTILRLLLSSQWREALLANASYLSLDTLARVLGCRKQTGQY